MKFLFLAIALLVPCVVVAQDKRDISGKLELANDKFVLHAEKEISVRQGEQSVSSKRIQVIGGVSQLAALQNFVGQKIKLAGEVAHASSREHTEKLIFYPDRVPTTTLIAAQPAPEKVPLVPAATPTTTINEGDSTIIFATPPIPPTTPAGNTVNIFATMMEQNIKTRVDIKEETSITTITDNSIRQNNLFVAQTGDPGMAGTWVAEYNAPLVAKNTFTLRLEPGGKGGSINMTGHNYWTADMPAGGADFAGWRIEKDYLVVLNGGTEDGRFKILQQTSGLLVLQLTPEMTLNFTRK